MFCYCFWHLKFLLCFASYGLWHHLDNARNIRRFSETDTIRLSLSGKPISHLQDTSNIGRCIKLVCNDVVGTCELGEAVRL